MTNSLINTGIDRTIANIFIITGIFIFNYASI